MNIPPKSTGAANKRSSQPSLMWTSWSEPSSYSPTGYRTSYVWWIPTRYSRDPSILTWRRALPGQHQRLHLCLHILRETGASDG